MMSRPRINRSDHDHGLVRRNDYVGYLASRHEGPDDGLGFSVAENCEPVGCRADFGHESIAKGPACRVTEHNGPTHAIRAEPKNGANGGLMCPRTERVEPAVHRDDAIE